MDFKVKAKELVEQMTVEEKASQLKYDAPAIERLSIPSYNWWNEALHGVARAGTATMFPQAIGMAAMFDKPMMKKVGDIVSTVTALIQGSPDIEWQFIHKIGSGGVELDTRELREILGDVPLDNYEVIKWIEGYLKEGYESVEIS